VCFLWHFPEGRPWWPLATTVALSCSDFPPARSRRTGDRPTRSIHLSARREQEPQHYYYSTTRACVRCWANASKWKPSFLPGKRVSDWSRAYETDSSDGISERKTAIQKFRCIALMFEGLRAATARRLRQSLSRADQPSGGRTRTAHGQNDQPSRAERLLVFGLLVETDHVPGDIHNPPFQRLGGEYLHLVSIA